MTGRLMQSLVHAVRRSVERGASGADADLLQRFLATHDATAFELLVWRHGAMVEAVCRRVLGDSPDVEDAFQATFIALWQQGRSIRTQAALAGWLHRVALRVARRVRRGAAQRRRRECSAARPERVGPDEGRGDLGAVLHEEIDRLPDAFRLPFVACQLEGRTVAEAAILFGVPRGTILSRLARARDRLRRGLLRRGITPAVAAAALAGSAASVSAGLARTAIQTIQQIPRGTAVAAPLAALAEGAIRDMTNSKLKLVVCLLLAVAVLGAGTVLLSGPGAQARPDDKPQPTDNPGAEKKRGDADRLQGTWKMVAVRANGKEQEEGKTGTITIEGNSMLFKKRPDHAGDRWTFKLDAKASPSSIDIDVKGATMPGIYELKGDSLRLCFSERGSKRPTDFASEKGSGVSLIELKRDKSEAKPAPRPLGDDANALREEIARLRRLLEEAHLANRLLQVDLESLKARAETARVKAESQRRQAEDSRERAEEALQKARNALERYREEVDRAKSGKKEEKKKE